jgi:chromosome segregation ATPase
MRRKSRPVIRPRVIREENPLRERRDPRAEPGGTVPPVSGPSPLAGLPTQSGPAPRRESSSPGARTPIPPGDYPELTRLRREIESDHQRDAVDAPHEETIQQLQAELHALSTVERELRERTIDRSVRVAELEEALARKNRRIAELESQGKELATARELLDRAGRKIAELEETVRRERADKSDLAEVIARVQRVLAELSKPR